MNFRALLSWGSILLILLFSVMSFFHLITHETLGLLEAVLLCCVWLGANTGGYSRSSVFKQAIPVAVIAVIVVVWLVNPLLFVYVPAIGINLLLAVFFFSTLRPGSVPAITRIARVERDDFSEELYVYTRKLTWAWALFFSCLIIEAIGLIAFASTDVTLLFLNIVNYILIAVFFLAENIFRRIYLSEYTHMPLKTLVARLSRRGIMSLIRYQESD